MSSDLTSTDHDIENSIFKLSLTVFVGFCHFAVLMVLYNDHVIFRILLVWIPVHFWRIYTK